MQPSRFVRYLTVGDIGKSIIAVETSPGTQVPMKLNLGYSGGLDPWVRALDVGRLVVLRPNGTLEALPALLRYHGWIRADEIIPPDGEDFGFAIRSVEVLALSAGATIRQAFCQRLNPDSEMFPGDDECYWKTACSETWALDSVLYWHSLPRVPTEIQKEVSRG